MRRTLITPTAAALRDVSTITPMLMLAVAAMVIVSTFLLVTDGKMFTIDEPGVSDS